MRRATGGLVAVAGLPKGEWPTRAQWDLYVYLLEFTMARGYQPALDEMGARFGWTSRSAPLVHLRPLVAKGWLEVARPPRARAVRFLRQVDGTPFRGFVCAKGGGDGEGRETSDHVEEGALAGQGAGG